MSIRFAGWLALGLAVGSAAFGAVVPALPRITQEVSFEFADEAAARAATAVPTLLAPGEKLVFSARWDDRNVRSLALAKALAPTGLRSTFYVNGRSDPDYAAIMREEIALGNSIGCHTLRHAYMRRLLPAKSFREILECRIGLCRPHHGDVCPVTFHSEVDRDHDDVMDELILELDLFEEIPGSDDLLAEFICFGLAVFEVFLGVGIEFHPALDDIHPDIDIFLSGDVDAESEPVEELRP